MPPEHQTEILVLGGALFVIGSLILILGTRSVVRDLYHRYFWVRTQALIVEQSPECRAGAEADTDSDGNPRNLWLTIRYRSTL